jgi:class 3 adenylate cyclase
LRLPVRLTEYPAVNAPTTRYAKTADGVHIAFQEFGQGDTDLLLIPGHYTNVDAHWDLPEIADLLRRLASFTRVILMDRRGVGLSDRLGPGSTAPLESDIDDVLAVLDTVHAGTTAVVASENATPLAVSLAAIHPGRVQALGLYAPLPAPFAVVTAGWTDIPDHERALIYSPQHWLDELDREWGTGWARADFEMFAPSLAGDAAAIESWGRYLRSAASPGSAMAHTERWLVTDVRGVYPAVQAPTILLFRPSARPSFVMRRIVQEAERSIPGARVVELRGRDLHWWFGDHEELAGELEAFLTGARRSHPATSDRVLSTVLFTDIVGSTGRQAAMGDQEWKQLVIRHHALVRQALTRWRGVENDTAGDGFYATFDGPARAIRCAQQIVDEVQSLGIEVRVGIHTGECEVIEHKLAGITVSIGARVATRAGPSEVLISKTVKDLVAGSGLTFEDAGEHELKGVPDHWHLYRVAPEA